jgi:phytanoyl-CoA dioxygenase PhyH
VSNTENSAPCLLTEEQREQFVRDGFVCIENAFSSAVAADARAILWRETGCDPDDPKTWTRPVIRIGDCAQEPFRIAANTPALHRAFDELVGCGRWIPRESLGGFPIRFPSAVDPGDTGWHVDASYASKEPVSSYFEWRVNFRSKGRALLMLFLFSDVGMEDAPTRIRIGSHLRIPSLLAPSGEDGMTSLELGIAAASATEGMQEALALGRAGTVYLCHPFLVHAAQPHGGKTPRFMAQPPLFPKAPFKLDRADGNYSLIEKAILAGLSRGGL